MADQRPPLLPRPPASRNAVDFVVIMFVVTVASILVLATVTIIVAELIDPDQDRSALAGTLLDIVTTIIGALIGFIAGKGAGKSEAHEDLAQERREERAARGDTT